MKGDSAHPAQRTTLAVSVVMEWENVLLADADRSRQMLGQVGRQARELLLAVADESGDGSGASFPPVSSPIELIVMYDGGRVDGSGLTSFVQRAIGIDDQSLEVRLVPMEGGTYFELKNAGARLAGGDVVVFVDSDVIPEDDWLARLLRPFSEPRVQVVSGNSYIDPDGLYGKAFALFWFFPLRADDAPVYEHGSFFGNNVAFRKTTLERFPFPSVEGATRGAGNRLAAILREEGIPIHRNPSARVRHPPPNGLRHFVIRALAEGRDELVRARTFGDEGERTVRASLARYRSHLRRSVYRIRSNRSRVGLSPGAVGAAYAIAGAYYTIYALGELATHVAPRAATRRWQI